MKYIMFETADGAKLPILFPDSLTHAFMAVAIQAVIRKEKMIASGIRSAGFVSLGLEVETHGGSESLGGVKSREVDAAYIALGESISHSPPELAEMMLQQAKVHYNG